MARKLILGLIIFFVLIGGIIIYAQVEFGAISFLIFLLEEKRFIDDQIPLTVNQKVRLDNDCLSNEIFRLAGCKYDLQNDPRGLSLMIEDRDPFNQFDPERSEFILSGDCVGSTFRNVDVQIGLHVDFIEGVIDQCKSKITFDSFDWGLKITSLTDMSTIHNFVRIDTKYACERDLTGLPVPFLSSITFPPPCFDENDDGVPDGGYDELQAECQGILGVDCPLGLTCEFREVCPFGSMCTESFCPCELIPIQDTCVIIR